MRDDTRDPNGYSRAYDDHNYEPTKAELDALYKQARECGASRDEAIEFVREMTW